MQQGPDHVKYSLVQRASFVKVPSSPDPFACAGEADGRGVQSGKVTGGMAITLPCWPGPIQLENAESARFTKKETPPPKWNCPCTATAGNIRECIQVGRGGIGRIG